MNSSRLNHIVDGILITIALISLWLMYSALEYEIIDFFEMLSSLEWYWYFIVFVLASIKPIISGIKLLRGKKNESKK